MTGQTISHYRIAKKLGESTLMLNGRYDADFPMETSQIPMFRFLGTPEKDKRHVVFESGHVPPMQGVIKEALDWLDRYLGPVM